MALLQKKPQLSSNLPIYSTGMGDNRYLIVGLGNPDKKYAGTRHNIGFSCLDAFTKEHGFPAWSTKKDLQCLFSSQLLGSTQVITIKPTTYMNRSGSSVRAVSQYYKISLDKIMVVYDDLDVRFGQLKTQLGGSSAGHNGIKSIMDEVGKDFARVRVGISPTDKQTDSSAFVLAPFSKEEQEHIPTIEREVTALLTEYVFSNTPITKETRSIL